MFIRMRETQVSDEHNSPHSVVTHHQIERVPRHIHQRVAPSPSVCTFMALESLRPSALRQIIAVTVMSRADQGCEKTNMAVTLSGGSCSGPAKTSRPMASLLPTCPGGVGRM